jgi:glutamate racemase
VRVLFDQGTPAPLRQLLTAHEVSTAFEYGWSSLKNGELLAMAEAQKFQVLVRTDRQLKYQQNLASRTIAIVVLGTTSWPRIQAAGAAVAAAIQGAASGTYTEVPIP